MGTDRESRRVDYIAAAREAYEVPSRNSGDCDIEIDDDAKLSENDQGAWVQAWIFIRDDDLMRWLELVEDEEDD